MTQIWRSTLPIFCYNNRCMAKRYDVLACAELIISMILLLIAYLPQEVVPPGLSRLLFDPLGSEAINYSHNTPS